MAPPRAKPPVLRVSDLRVFRGGTPVLAGISWTVARGHHWGILGPNGSGKTSLLAALTGYLTPTAGRIQLLGREYGRADWPALRRRVGLVSSSLRQQIHEDEPALEIVVGGRYAAIDVRDEPRPRDAKEARLWLRRVGCTPLADRPWAHLSQGERQRVLIARALMAHPDVLILDEPCAGLDPVARHQFLGLVSTLASRRSPAVVLVTHHVEEIVPEIGHILLLRDGRVAASGPLRETLTSANLSAAFGAPLLLRHTPRDGFHLEIPARSRLRRWTARGAR